MPLQNKKKTAASNGKEVSATTGLTIQQIQEYYQRMVPRITPFVKDKPVLAHAKEGKRLEVSLPVWMERAQISTSAGELRVVPLGGDERTLLHLVEKGAHSFDLLPLMRENTTRPDRLSLFFKWEGKAPKETIKTIHKVRELMGRIKAPLFFMLVPETGLLGTVPLRGEDDAKEVGEFVGDLKSKIAGGSAAARRAVEGGMIQLSTGQHELKLPVAYSIRLMSNAPIATPIEWDEINNSLDARRYTVRNIFRRVEGMRRDPWGAFNDAAVSLRELRRRL